MSILMATLFGKAPELCGVVSFANSTKENDTEIEPEVKNTMIQCAIIAGRKRRERAEDAYIAAIESGHLTTSAIAKHLNREVSSVQQHMNKLLRRGIVKKCGFEDGD